ncbi:hypothetical protein B0I35DRAFT_267294 [Stachybotrys elegans]|uniref:Rhodopsin domain-containing protein n=1 Tax=Stachybotrys elegans TaxID=80388 RepID=A0A8K0WQQ8_9HYPO|nr:hypothetical protein B0I35DRAFT_267294 [Stachybotrys elegans]
MNFEQYIAVEWLLVAICVIITTARLVVRSWKGIWRYWLSDLFLVLSLLFFIPIVAGDTYIFSIGQTFDTVEYTEPLAIWWFASTLIFDLGFYLARFSLLAFYYQLFPVSEVKPRILLWVVVAFNIGGLLATGFIDTFWCGANVSLNWASGDTACAASDDPVTAYIVWPLNVASEVFVFLLPFSILQRLNKLNKKEKTSLICIFLLGCATIAASVARFTLGVTNLFTLEACTSHGLRRDCHSDHSCRFTSLATSSQHYAQTTQRRFRRAK